MRLNEYQKEVMRTVPKSYPGLDPENHYEISGSHKLHAMLGITSEAGEIADALKKAVIYNQELDIKNLIEECGDLMWYIALLLNSLHSSMEQTMEENIEKLKIRYPEKFTEQCAISRADKHQAYPKL